MEGVKFYEQIIINCMPAEAFDYTQNYENRLKWDTFLTKAELMDGATRADIGVKAFCVAKNGVGMVTEYVSYNRPKVTAVKMTAGPYMFKSFLGSWNFRDVGNMQTEVTFLYLFRLRFPFNLVTSLIKNNLRINVKQRLKDLKNNIEARRV